MEWIKFTDKIPENDDNICVLIYEDWSRDQKTKEKYPAFTEPDECWHVCGGYYDKKCYYIPCPDGVEGGIAGIYNDYYEGQLIYAVAWCPMPKIEKLR